MNFNLMSMVKMANAIKNPNEAINLLLNKFGEKHPEVANNVRNAIRTGKDPAKFIMEQANKGVITLDNLQQLKKYYGMAQKFGLTKKVPDNIWVQAENAIKNSSNINKNIATNSTNINNTNNTGFSGF